ncbi:MAG TPA: hypothetical protein DIT64_11875 [Verrucomicrobiales bacterium]|mgnify:FL=1|nr:hypothetical protein [Verrucomicrobiales bacterium]
MKDTPVHLFLTTELFHPDLPGGLMRFFRYGPGLKERGVTPHVITLRHRPELRDEDEANGILIHRLDPPDSAPGELQRAWLLRQALRRAREVRRQEGAAVLQPGILSHTMTPSLAGARMRGIGCVHNISIAPETALKTGGIARLRQRLRMGWMCAPVSRFVFLSHQLRRQYQQRWPLRAAQIQVIPNGVDLGRFHPSADAAERAELRARHGLGGGQKIALFVGGIMARKGVDILLRAWDQVLAEHPDAVLLVLGSRGGRVSHERAGFKDELAEYLRQMDELRARCAAPESIRFLGEAANPAPYYRMADVFAFPSRREGLPNVVLEAMASALPCLVARFDGMPQNGEEFGHADRHFHALSHEPGEWAARLARILRDDQDGPRRKMGALAREWIESHHNLPTILDQWSRLYREAAGQR